MSEKTAEYVRIADESTRAVLRYEAETEKDGWVLKVEKQSPEGPIRSYTKQIPGNANVCMKAVGIVNAAVDATFGIISDLPRRHELDPGYTSVTVVQRIDATHAVTHSTFAGALGGLISPRDFVVACYCGPVEGGGFSIGGSSCVHPDKPPQKGYVRGENFPCAWIVRPVAENKCRVVYIAHADIKGMVPRSMVNKAVVSMSTEFFGRINHLLTGRPLPPPQPAPDEVSATERGEDS